MAYLRYRRSVFDQISTELALSHIYLMSESTSSTIDNASRRKIAYLCTRPAIKTYLKTQKSKFEPKFEAKKIFFFAPHPAKLYRARAGEIE
jgi:hypothetical protein